MRSFSVPIHQKAPSLEFYLCQAGLVNSDRNTGDREAGKARLGKLNDKTVACQPN